MITQERYRQFLDEAEALIRAFNQQVAQQADKETHFCAAGCSTCCCQVFRVSAFELAVIARKIRHDPQLFADFQRLNARRKMQIEENMAEIEKISRLQDLQEFSVAWLKLKIPCALLDEGKCLIYEIRPAVCATYLSLAPPRVCAIDPKGYRSKAMHTLQARHVEQAALLEQQNGLSNDSRFDLSWHLDQLLNAQDAKAKEESES